jgi:Protein of unknown function (DUF3761)
MKEYFNSMSSVWKYSLIAVLTFLSVPVAVTVAGLSNSLIAQPKTIQSTYLDQQVKGAQSPTNTPTPESTATPALSPTLTPYPTHVYIAPTTPYTPPTQTPASQTNGQLDNNNSYTNVDGNQVHSPANTVDGSVPAGATAQCGDGTYSFSQHHSGTCSHHGGVAEWL